MKWFNKEFEILLLLSGAQQILGSVKDITFSKTGNAIPQNFFWVLDSPLVYQNAHIQFWFIGHLKIEKIWYENRLK